MNPNLTAMINKGCPSELAQQVLDILEAQNRGELPAQLPADKQAIVTKAWQYLTGQVKETKE